MNKLVARLVEPIVAASDVAEAAAVALHCIYEELGGVLRAAFSDPRHAIEANVPGWTRFAAVTALFNMSMTDLDEALRAGDFSRFSASEVEGLVGALWEDSPKRARLLSAVRG